LLLNVGSGGGAAAAPAAGGASGGDSAQEAAKEEEKEEGMFFWFLCKPSTDNLGQKRKSRTRIWVLAFSTKLLFSCSLASDHGWRLDLGAD